MRVLLLGGSGHIGRFAARRLATSDLVSDVGIVGRNQESLKRCVSEVGPKAHAIQFDIRDEERVATVAADHDVVANAAGPEFEVLLPALRGAIAAGTHYCDIGADASMTERQLELDAPAKERNVVAVVGIGTYPGLANLLALHAFQQFDRVEHVQLCCFWHLPASGYSPADALDEFRRTGRPNATWHGVFQVASRPVRLYHNREWAVVNPLDRPIDIQIPGNGRVRAYPLGTSDLVTLPRFLPRVESVSNAWCLFPPQVNELVLREGQRMAREHLSPVEAATSFFSTIAADPDRWLQIPPGYPARNETWATATGWKDGRRARYTCWPLRVPDSTSLALTLATLRILRGEVSARGVVAPEACFDPMSWFEEAGGHAKEEARDKPLLGERFDRLEQ